MKLFNKIITIMMAFAIVFNISFFESSAAEQDNNQQPSRQDELKVPSIQKDQKEMVVFKDDGINYMPIQYGADFSNEGTKINEVSAAIDNENIYIKLKYTASKDSYLYLFLQGDTPGLEKLYEDGTKEGNNTVIIKLNRNEVLGYRAGLAINLGDRNFIFIQKNLLNNICYNPNNAEGNIPFVEKYQTEMVRFQDDGIIYMPINYRYHFDDERDKINEVSAAMDNENVYVKLKYTAMADNYLGIFLQGDTPGLKELYKDGTRAGDNTVIIKLNKKEALEYKAGLAINIGGRNFIFIDKSLIDNICKDSDNGNKIPYIKKDQKEMVEFQDDGIEYMPIDYKSDFEDKRDKINEVSAAMDNENVYIKLKYTAMADNYLCIFLQGDTPGLKELYPNGTKAGDNTVIIKLNKAEALEYKAGLAINIADRNFIFIDKGLLDNICKGNGETPQGSIKEHKHVHEDIDFRVLPCVDKEQNDFMSYEDDNIQYMPISYGVEFDKKQCVVSSIGAVVDDNNVYIKVKFQSNEMTDIGVFLQGNAEGLKKFYKNGVKQGNNTAIIKLDKKSTLDYTEGIGIIIGDRNYVFIEKQLIDIMCLIDVSLLNNY